MLTRAALLLLAATLVAIGCAPANTPASAELAAASGFPLPSVVLDRFDGSGGIDTADLVGTPLVLNIWATWCAYCVEELPAIEQVHGELGGRVRFVGVDRADDADRARQLANRTGVTYELLADPDGELFAALGARAMPTTVLVDATGEVVHRHPGPLDAVRLRQLISDHLGQ